MDIMLRFHNSLLATAPGRQISFREKKMLLPNSTASFRVAPERQLTDSVLNAAKIIQDGAGELELCHFGFPVGLHLQISGLYCLYVWNPASCRSNWNR